MSTLPVTTTEQTAKSAFRAHGRVEYRAQGRILESIATGPFNNELMEALFDLAKSSFPTMAATGPWANIAIFRESAMCTPDVLTHLTEALRHLASADLVPVCTAYVLPEQVEGARFMGPLYAKCYNDVGLTFAWFKQLPEAQAWTASKLGTPSEQA